VTDRHRVVVVGAGFGGLFAARRLGGRPVDVTLVDRRNHHLFQPLLYQVATGMLSPGQIAPPIRHIVRRHRNVRVELAEVTGFDLDRRVVKVRHVPIRQEVEIAYDSLIVATGSNQSYFGHDELARFAPGMKTVDDARELRGVLSDRTVPAEHKGTLLTSIFAKKASPAALALLKQAAATRTGSFDTVLARFADEVAARRQRQLAEVRSAYELGDAELERLAEALTARYGHDVHLNVIIDPSIVGGLRVAIGDDVIDGTVSGRLEDARRQLAG
jgi:ATP synthase F1 delta subunit